MIIIIHVNHNKTDVMAQRQISGLKIGRSQVQNHIDILLTFGKELLKKSFGFLHGLLKYIINSLASGKGKKHHCH